MSETFVLKGKHLYTLLSNPELAAAGGFGADVMLDRIINVKINYNYYAQDYTALAQSVIIRSDYESVWGPAFVSPDTELMKASNALVGSVFKKPTFKKVAIKPDIRFKYVGHGNTGIECEVTIHNLFMLVEDFAKELNTVSAGIKIQSIEVLFGYLSQFPDLRYYVGPESAEVYSNFTHSVYSNVSYFKGDVLYWYRSAQPPDGAYTFKCAVTSITMPDAPTMKKLAVSPIMSDADIELVTASYEAYIASHGYSAVGLCNLRDIITYYVTKHYVKNEIMSTPMFVNSVTHELTEVGSNLYGIQVYIMSPKIYKTVLNYPPFIGFASNAVGMLNTIKAAIYPNLEYRFGLDGNVYIYDASENISDYEYHLELLTWRTTLNAYNLGIRARVMAAEKNYPGLYRNDVRPFVNRKEVVTIPAVYSLQYGPLTQISCPFFGALNPGQILDFNAAYSIAQQATASLAVQPPTGLVTYTLLYYDIDFSTVSEYNNVNIFCVPSM